MFICQRTSRCSRAERASSRLPSAAVAAADRSQGGPEPVRERVKDFSSRPFVPSRLFSSHLVMESDAAVSAESRKRKREEYEMQLFGFHSRAVYATLKNIVMERIQSRSQKLCETLKKIYKPDSDKLAVLNANEERLIKAYYAASVPHLRNMENIVSKFIAVPDNVLAEEDKLQGIQYTEAELESMRGKLEEFQQRAKRAAILNAALKEELQLVEQFSICADNTDRLSHIIESGVACPDVSDKIHQLVEDYKQFSAFLNDGTPVSQKSLYTTIDDLECIDCDMDSL